MSNLQDLTPRQKRAVALRLAGATLDVIAAEMGISTQRVHQLLRKFTDGVAFKRRCKRCDAQFTTTRIKKVYCKDSCADEARKERFLAGLCRE